MSDIFLILFIVIPLVVLWAIVLSDIIIRKDLTPGRKFLWAAVSLILAEFGALLYLIMRPFDYPEQSTEVGQESSTETMTEEMWAETAAAAMGDSS